MVERHPKRHYSEVLDQHYDLLVSIVQQDPGKPLKKEDLEKELMREKFNSHDRNEVTEAILAFKKDYWVDDSVTPGYVNNLLQRNVPTYQAKPDAYLPTDKIQSFLLVPNTGVMDEKTREAIIADKREHYVDPTLTNSVLDSIKEYKLVREMKLAQEAAIKAPESEQAYENYIKAQKAALQHFKDNDSKDKVQGDYSNDFRKAYDKVSGKKDAWVEAVGDHRELAEKIEAKNEKALLEDMNRKLHAVKDAEGVDRDTALKEFEESYRAARDHFEAKSGNKDSLEKIDSLQFRVGYEKTNGTGSVDFARKAFVELAEEASTEIAELAKKGKDVDINAVAKNAEKFAVALDTDGNGKLDNGDRDLLLKKMEKNGVDVETANKTLSAIDGALEKIKLSKNIPPAKEAAVVLAPKNTQSVPRSPDFSLGA